MFLTFKGPPAGGLQDALKSAIHMNTSLEDLPRILLASPFYTPGRVFSFELFVPLDPNSEIVDSALTWDGKRHFMLRKTLLKISSSSLQLGAFLTPFAAQPLSDFVEPVSRTVLK